MHTLGILTHYLLASPVTDYMETIIAAQHVIVNYVDLDASSSSRQLLVLLDAWEAEGITTPCTHMIAVVNFQDRTYTTTPNGNEPTTISRTSSKSNDSSNNLTSFVQHGSGIPTIVIHSQMVIVHRICILKGLWNLGAIVQPGTGSVSRCRIDCQTWS